MSPWFSDPRLALYAVESLAAVGVCISSLEHLVARRHLDDRGLLNWPVARLRSRWVTHGVVFRALDPLLHYPAVLAIVGVQLLGALALLATAPASSARAPLCSAVALTSLLLLVRHPFGNDGADQMSLLVFAGASLARCASSDLVLEACLWFLALQACLSYLTAGAVKVVAPRWRDGSALAGVFRTATYGATWADRLLKRHPALAACGARGVIAIECAFPLALVLPPPARHLLLAGGLAFHLAAAGIMGLNTFLWAFAATYPAILHCSGRLAAWWG